VSRPTQVQAIHDAPRQGHKVQKNAVILPSFTKTQRI
jgi:hypothetical protein